MVCSMVNSVIIGQRYRSVYDSVVGQVREGGDGVVGELPNVEPPR